MDSSKIPDYLIEGFARVAEEHGFSDYNLEVSPGCKPGDGFVSELFRITISEKVDDTKKLNLICKIAPNGMDSFTISAFKNEAHFYGEIMPLFTKFQNKRNVPKDEQFQSLPKCYATFIDEERQRYAIILEDLRPNGFQMWDKSKLIPIENLRLIMRELGKFHGLSIAMKNQRPDKFAVAKQAADMMKISFETESIREMFRDIFDRTIDSMKKEQYKSIMRNIKENMLKYVEDCLDGEETDDLTVLCHGDLWSNNILYRLNNENTADDVRFLDWQIIRYGSLAADVLYIIFSSTDKALRDKEYHYLIALYHKSMANIVKLLGSDPEKLCSLENVKNELKRYGYLAPMMVPMLIEISQSNSSEMPKSDERNTETGAEGGAEGGAEATASLGTPAQLEIDRRLNELLEDVVNLGYYRQID